MIPGQMELDLDVSRETAQDRLDRPQSPEPETLPTEEVDHVVSRETMQDPFVSERCECERWRGVDACPEHRDSRRPATPMMEGTFAVYPRDDGAWVLVVAGPAGDVQRHIIPAMIVKMLAGGGGPIGARLRGMFSGGESGAATGD